MKLILFDKIFDNILYSDNLIIVNKIELHIKNLLLTLTIIVGSATLGYAQQGVQYTQYMYDGSLINPAYAGAEDALSISLLHRDQWSGLEGAPQSQTFSLHTPLKSPKVGTGLFLHRESIGVHQNLTIATNLAYHLPLGNNRYFSFGLKAGMINVRSDYQSLQNGNPDPSVNDELFSGTDFNAGFGFYYKSKKFEAGYSIPSIVNRSINVNDSVSLDPINLNHLLFSQYHIPVGKNLVISPGILLKYLQGIPVSYDLNLLTTFKNVITAGVSYRKQESVDFLVRFNLTPQFQMAYAYDYPIGNVSRLAQASNEIMLRYIFKFRYENVNSPQ
ncbi:type IX secretion system membrane protein, PorP/SprF family [Marivirga sericea]|uniref:Type IX secretion system membrane protein, PorP/SprF family n=1 Tax=Marivirga sericea TaxID=1028 RepID=A0A1X7IEW9_9BACT|nr:type IX secretion system membrane protein PorP/SprF [Marivirga sericea]SMG13031.1 type IX secretion system membrane protein, PorP/SprF family [Marivirga sericea]